MRLSGAPLLPAGLQDSGKRMLVSLRVLEAFLVSVAKPLWPPGISCRGCVDVETRVQNPRCFRPPYTLITNFSSGSVRAGHWVAQGGGAGGMPLRSPSRCLQNPVGQRLQKNPESPPTRSQPRLCDLEDPGQAPSSGCGSLGVSRPPGDVAWKEYLIPKVKHLSVTSIFPPLISVLAQSH